MKGMPLPTPPRHAVQHRARGIVEIYDCFVALEVTAGHQLFAGGRLKYVAKHGQRGETSNSFRHLPHNESTIQTTDKRIGLSYLYKEACWVRWCMYCI